MSNENAAFGSAPNLAARSYSRSRSREHSKEPRNETWSTDGSVDPPEVDTNELRPLIKDTKLDSFEEEREESKEKEVTEEEDLDDFWGSSGD